MTYHRWSDWINLKLKNPMMMQDELIWSWKIQWLILCQINSELKLQYFFAEWLSYLEWKGDKHLVHTLCTFRVLGAFALATPQSFAKIQVLVAPLQLVLDARCIEVKEIFIHYKTAETKLIASSLHCDTFATFEKQNRAVPLCHVLVWLESYFPYCQI